MAKDKRGQRKPSHQSVGSLVNYVTKGWSKEKRSAFHEYLHKHYKLEKNNWDKDEYERQARIFETYFYFGS